MLLTPAGGIPTAFASTEPLTIECSHWRNPVLPSFPDVYSFYTYDFNGKLIDRSEAADAFPVVPGGGKYAASPIADQDITYSLSGAGMIPSTVAGAPAKAPIQSLSTYKVSIVSPVPLEVASPAAGAPAVACYLEVEFPRELTIAAGSRAYKGLGLLATSGRGNSLETSVTPVLEDFSGPRALVVFKGCANTALHGQRKVSTVLGFEMPNIKNPYAEQDTSAFSIKIFASYDVATKTGSQEIAATTAFVIPASAYGSGALTDIKVTPANLVVQEPTSQDWQFTIQNEIPGAGAAAAASGIQAGVHIHLPSSFTTGNTAITPKVTGASITGAATATVDKTAVYDPLC